MKQVNKLSKNTHSKKAPVIAVIAVTIFMQMMSTTAHAIVGIATLNWPLFIYGILGAPAIGVPLAAATCGAGGLVEAPLEGKNLGQICSDEVPVSSYAALGVAYIVGAVGAIVMDGEAQQTFEFTSLTEAQGLQLKLSENEIKIFNAEIDEANAVMEQASAEFKQLKHPTPHDSVQIWSSLKSSVSPETFKTMSAILAGMKASR